MVGGYELNCRDVAEELRRRGHDVVVLTSRAGAAGVAEAGVERRLLLKSRRDLPSVHDQRAFGRNRFVTERHNARAVREVIDRIGADRVVVWNGSNLGRGVLTALEASRPVTYFAEDTWLTLELQPRRGAAPVRVARAAYDTVVAMAGVPRGGARLADVVYCSDSLRRRYAALGARDRGHTVIHLGVDADLFEWKPPHLLEAPALKRILYVGQLVPEKGISTLLRAFALLAAERPDIALTLVGGFRTASYEREVAARAAAAPHPDRVTVSPLRPRTELPGLLHSHDVFAFTTEQDEAFGLALVEAMACGIPVVAALSGAVSEIVTADVTALVYPAGDPVALAERLAATLADPAGAAARSKAARADVERRFTVRAQAAALEAHLTRGGRRGS